MQTIKKMNDCHIYISSGGEKDSLSRIKTKIKSLFFHKQDQFAGLNYIVN